MDDENLVVNEENMTNNFQQSYNLVYSQRVMLALIEKGVSREEAYKTVQTEALSCWNEAKDFKGAVLKNKKITFTNILLVGLIRWKKQLKSEKDWNRNLGEHLLLQLKTVR